MLKHIEPSDRILFLMGFGLSEKERQDIEKHLDECKNCKKQMEETDKTLQQIQNNSQVECEAVRDNLADYTDGKLPLQRKEEIDSHLDQCITCNFLYKEITIIPTIEELDRLPERIPQDLWPKLKKTIWAEFAKKSFIEAKSRLIEKVRSISTALGELVLILEPLPLPMAVHTRGKKKREPILLNHEGGDICLRVDKAGLKVQILSLDGRQKGEQISDESGLVVFENPVKGMYRLKVKDHDVVEVRVKVFDDSK